MLSILLMALTVSIGVSFLCSLMEASLYAVSHPYVRSRADGGDRVGQILLHFKEDMGKPIAAILIMNTVAHTAGAAVCGWAVGELYGSAMLLPFSIAYTLAVLYLSEILPKLLGVAYPKIIASAAALPLALLIRIVYPFIWVSDLITRRINPENKGQTSTQEVLTMAEMGTEEGSLDPLEGSVIANIIHLDKLLVREVLTPRVVLVRALESQTLAEARSLLESCTFSRIPLCSAENPDHLTGYVTQRDVLWELLLGNGEKTLKETARPLTVVPELLRCDKLLLRMLEQKEHIYAVVDEHGGLVGIITLEDILEKIIGLEIVDEYDAVSNMRDLARLLSQQKEYRNSETAPQHDSLNEQNAELELELEANVSFRVDKIDT